MSKLVTITREYVDDLIDFAPTDEIRAAGISELQRDGSVALFNMLVRNGVAYLADEVGMGKTYIGLALMSLLRYQKTDARVLILTPRRNIQEKWAADLQNFVRYNWRRADHRIKTPQGSPVFPVRTPERLADWINNLHDDEIGTHDTILRTTSFSFATDDESGDAVKSFREKLSDDVRPQFSCGNGPQTLDDFASALRTFLSAHPYDLIIVDEAHNLKHGFTPGAISSIRNEMMYRLFGEVAAAHPPWLLMLSATPMENGDPVTLVRQFEVFGRVNDLLLDAPGQGGESIRLHGLRGEDNGAGHDFKTLRVRQKRLIVRRVGELRLPDQSALTRNMYRREWRAGGVVHPELPLERPSSAVRLVNAVLQKNVFEMLQATSGGRFRVGALESFEIYSGRHSFVTGPGTPSTDAPDTAPDQHVIARLSESFREIFDDEVPHPKLNAVSERLSAQLKLRDKALVFVRRVATTSDLAARVSYAFDDELSSRLSNAVRVEDRDRVRQLVAAWVEMRSKRQFEESAPGDNAKAVKNLQTVTGQEGADLESDEVKASLKEVVPSMFTWFFRGRQDGMVGFKDIFGGRRLREHLEASSRLCLVLEENYIDWLLGRPDGILNRLGTLLGKAPREMLEGIRYHLPISIIDQSSVRRQFHAVQFAALNWLLEQSPSGFNPRNVRILKYVLYPNVVDNSEFSHDVDLEVLEQLLETRGLYPELARVSRDSPLSAVVARGVFVEINEAANFDFRQALRRREQIRHTQMALLRHGAPLIDLYFAALKVRGGAFTQTNGENPPDVSAVARQLVKDWSAGAEGFESWKASGAWELAEICRNFDLIKKLNLHDLDQYDDEDRPLDTVFVAGTEPASDSRGRPRSARRLLNQELSGQAPTAAAQGGQSDERRHRITTQFRMPGMPWVLIATNVYEEGVDLHTYCRTIIHHGISHSASSVEQRTGRVDRIGGLVQRCAAEVGSAGAFTPDLMIQSLFPYQNDTFERYQVRRVLQNCNRFLQSLHETDAPVADSQHTDLQDKRAIPKQITDRLQSPFDVSDSPWLLGQLTTPDRRSDFQQDLYLRVTQAFEEDLVAEPLEVLIPEGQGLERRYQVGEVHLHLTPHSHREGDSMLLHIRIDPDEDGKLSRTISCDSSGGGWQMNALGAVSELLAQFSSADAPITAKRPMV